MTPHGIWARIALKSDRARFVWRGYWMPRRPTRVGGICSSTSFDV